MKLEIKDKKENKLLGRVEVEGVLSFEGAVPSNEVVKDRLTAELKANKDLVIIKHIYSKFSAQEADFLAFVYDSKEAMEKMEVMTKHLKKKAEAEKKAAEEKKEEKAVEEAPKEEKPAEPEEKKEEPVEEAPKEEEKKEEPKEEKPAEEAAPVEEEKKEEGGK